MSATTCPVLRPTMKEFSNFRKYLKTIEKYSDFGIVKVIPPAGWFSQRYDMEEIKHMVISSPINQLVNRTCPGVYNLGLLVAENMTVEQYMAFCEKNSYTGEDLNDMERKFWRSMGFNSGLADPMYGADMVGSLFGDDAASSWNVNRLDSPLQLIGNDLPGVSNSMLYFGSWRAMFAFHTEDMELYSINYVHIGSPKSWYSIPPQYKARFENAAQSYFPEEYRRCGEFLRHKLFMFSPTKLKDLGIKYNTIVQYQGEFVITYPGAYHAGFNHGFNIAEATNFATRKWLVNGRSAKVCACNPHSVKIDMDMFETMMRRDSRQRHQLQKFQVGSAARATAPSEEVGACALAADCKQAASHDSADDEDEEDECEDVDSEGEEGWLLRCMCGKRRLYGPAEGAAEGLVFLCAECGVWCHVACVYGSPGSSLQEPTSVPPYALCHLCQRLNASLEDSDGQLNGSDADDGDSGSSSASESDMRERAGNSFRGYVYPPGQEPTFPVRERTAARSEMKKKQPKKPTKSINLQKGDFVSVETAPHAEDLNKLEKGKTTIIVHGQIKDIIDSQIRVHQKNTRREKDYWVPMNDLVVVTAFAGTESCRSSSSGSACGRTGPSATKRKTRGYQRCGRGTSDDLSMGVTIMPTHTSKKHKVSHVVTNSIGAGVHTPGNTYTVQSVGCQVDLRITAPTQRHRMRHEYAADASGDIPLARHNGSAEASPGVPAVDCSDKEVVYIAGSSNATSELWDGEVWKAMNGSGHSGRCVLLRGEDEIADDSSISDNLLVAATVSMVSCPLQPSESAAVCHVDSRYEEGEGDSAKTVLISDSRMCASND